MFKEYDVSHQLSVSSYISIFAALSGVFAVRLFRRQVSASRGRTGHRFGCPASIAPPAGGHAAPAVWPPQHPPFG